MTIGEIKTPSYVIDEEKLKSNLEILAKIQNESGCRILLAQKALSTYSLYPLIGKYLAGTASSGIYEARLGYTEMGKENHIFAPAYKDDEIEELDEICGHIVFNSFSQLNKFAPRCKKAKLGIRINPEFSTHKINQMYDPCRPNSRLGITLKVFEEELEKNPDALKNITGFHMHTLCEQNSDDLVSTFKEAEKKFGKYLKNLEWLNLGGGHNLTRPDYDIKTLTELIKYIRREYGVTVYLEPGEAIGYDAGYLVSEVLDKVRNGMDILILDTSATCHMPDIFEMPYRPFVRSSGEPNEKKFTYRLASRTCLSGDVIGDYSFDREIEIGDRLIFNNMAVYSMVRNNMFNGLPLPSIYLSDGSGECRLIKEFSYDDFKRRL